MKIKELKEFLSTLSDEQLEQELFITGDEFKEHVESFEIIDEDLYFDVNSPEDGCFSRDDLIGIDEEDLVIGIPKGTVMINID